MNIRGRDYLDWADVVVVIVVLVAIIVVVILIGAIVHETHMKHVAPCDYFGFYNIKDVPARCVDYYMKGR